MILSIKNIGKIESARIQIEGITIIAGENNTGKSTVGKALFAVFNGFYNIQDQILSERIESVDRLLSFMYGRAANRLTRNFDTEEIAKDIIFNQKLYCGKKSALKQKIIQSILQYDEYFKKYMDSPVIEEVSGQIQEVLGVSDEEIFKSVLEKKINVEFSSQVNNLFSAGKGEIILQIKDDNITISVENNHVIDIRNLVSLHTEAVYMDDPFILDTPVFSFSGSNSGYMDHRMHLKSKLFFNEKGNNVVEEIIANNKIESIYGKISSVCEGEIVRKKQGEYGYRNSGSDKVIDIRNLSTGMKAFAILKTLLINGIVQYNGVIILDEPEIHLHPEWQLFFAELIVMLHKEFGVHVLLNTHSPYFLRAVQVYSAKYEVAERCKYYLSEERDNHIDMKDVSSNIEKIYAKLSKPLQDLEDERWRDG